MARLKYIAIGIILLLLTGCIPASLYPLYSEDTIVFEQKLVGSWSEADEEGVWDFYDTGDSSYRVTAMLPDSVRISFIGHLVKIDGHLFLDLEPTDYDSGLDEFTAIHLQPLHSIYLVTEIGQNLKLAPMNVVWLEDYLEQHPDEIAVKGPPDREHWQSRPYFLFVAPTKSLQAFVSRHADTPEAFLEPSTFLRVK